MNIQIGQQDAFGETFFVLVLDNFVRLIFMHAWHIEPHCSILYLIISIQYCNRLLNDLTPTETQTLLHALRRESFAAAATVVQDKQNNTDTAQ
jgi:hypothetical protein